MALTKTELCNMALSKIGNDRAQVTTADLSGDLTSVARQCNLHYEQTLKELVRMHTWNCTKARTELVETVPSITSSDDETFTYNSTVNTKAQFSNVADDERIQWNSTLSRWEYDSTYAVTFSATYYNTSTGDVPATSGWLKVSDGTDAGWTLTLNYNFGFTYAFRVPTDCLRPVYLTSTDESTQFLKPQIDWQIEVDTIVSNHSDVWLLYIKQPDPADMDSLFAQAFYTMLAAKLAKPIAGKEALGQQILQELYSVVMPEARRVNGFEGQESPVVDSEWLEATYTPYSNNNIPFGTATWTTSFTWS